MLAINLNSGSLHVEYPYGGEHGKNRNKPYATDDDRVLQHLAVTYSRNHPTMSLVNARCDSKVIVENSGTTHAGVAGNGHVDLFSDYLYLRTNTLAIDAFVTCCNTDDDEQIWYANRKSLLSMIEEVRKGASMGYVVNERNEPIADAVVSHDKSVHRVQTQDNGAYWLLLPAGSHLVTVEAPGYFQVSKVINVTEETRSAKIMIKMHRNESIFGMPRIVFVVMTGKRLSTYRA